MWRAAQLALPRILCMDENRDYGGHRGQGGYTAETVAQETIDMGDMVQRDRAHPSVFIWSFCNEVGCDNETAAAAFRNISYFYDGTRGVTQNHLGAGRLPISEKSLDVQGFSHKSGSTFDTFHSKFKKEPMMATRNSKSGTRIAKRPASTRPGNSALM